MARFGPPPEAARSVLDLGEGLRQFLEQPVLQGGERPGRGRQPGRGRNLQRGWTMPSFTARLRALPDAPTMAEAGYPDIEGEFWYGLLVPAGTPKLIITMLNRGTVTIIGLPEMKECSAALGEEPIGSTVRDCRGPRGKCPGTRARVTSSKISRVQFVRTLALALMHFGGGCMDQGAMRIESAQESCFIGRDAGLNSLESFPAYEKRNLPRAIVTPEPHGA
jgi:hypothetical protein